MITLDAHLKTIRELHAAQDQLAAVRGAARAVLEYRGDDVAMRAAVNVLLVKALGADAMRGEL